MFMVENKFKELEKQWKIMHTIFDKIKTFKTTSATMNNNLPINNNPIQVVNNIVHNFIQSIGATKKYQPIKLLSTSQMLAFNQVNPHQQIW
jgi:hypothetical protein